MVKPAFVRMILTVALASNWKIHQLDVNNLFLNGYLQEEVFMEQPPGFEHENMNLVCRLNKVIYGLKQAPRAWFQRLAIVLCNFGFVSSICDPSLFIQVTPHTTTYILVYVDDILITGSSPTYIQILK